MERFGRLVDYVRLDQEKGMRARYGANRGLAKATHPDNSGSVRATD
jgi:hypothetical protein